MTTVVTKIGDREAIPVRAVSFITHHQIDALALAGLLYENDLYYDGLAKVEKADIQDAQLKKGKRTLYAFRVNGGEIKKIAPVYWHDVFFDLKAIRENLRAFDAKHKTNSRQEFRKKSLKRLPAGIFLWRDDFEKVWGGLVAEDSADDNECETSFINETEGIRLIDYSPEMESKEIEQAVMEGFDVTLAAADTPVQKKEMVYLRDFHYLAGHHGMPDLTHCNSSKYSFLGLSVDEKGIYPDESREFKDFVNGLLPTEADVLLYQMLPKDYVYAPGKPLLTFPCSIAALRKMLDAIGESGVIDEERASEYVEADVGKSLVSESPTRTRRDPLAVEIIDVVVTLQKAGEKKVAPASVIRALQLRVSDQTSCIVGMTAGGLKWENASGEEVEITSQALKRRITYILKKQNMSVL